MQSIIFLKYIFISETDNNTNFYKNLFNNFIISINYLIF